jgi:hypothetical protein
MPVAIYSDVIEGRVRLVGQALVVSADKPLDKAKELVASGVGHADVRYIDLTGEQPLPAMVQFQIDRLRYLFKEPISILGDKVRLLTQWPEPPTWQPWLTGNDALDGLIRWRPRNLAVIVGDEGCGKSTFAQYLATQMLSGPTLCDTGIKASVCAWEDDLAVFRNRVYNLGGQALADRLYWFEPDADPDRLLDQYLERVEFLSKYDNCKLHVADPWNAFNHDWGSEPETRYVQKMLNAMERLTRSLNVTIIVVAHLPKRQGRGLRPFGIADASGSKAFANAASMGFCIVNTIILGELQDKTADELKAYKLEKHEVDTAISENGYRLLGDEHMIVAVDKVKVRGMESRSMGLKGVRAFVVDRDSGNLTHDPAASALSKLLWSRL